MQCSSATKAIFFLLAFSPAFPSGAIAQQTKPAVISPVLRHTLFVSGRNDTHTYRIPAIVTATNGDVIAACDARRKSAADLMHHRTIDIVFRRSRDNGQTWTPIELLENRSDGGCSDPSLLVDQVTGTVFCFYNFMSADKTDKEFRFMLHTSSDHGQTWSDPVDITDQIADRGLKHKSKFITSGRGIQTSDGSLMHNYVRVGDGITLFKSDDHGASWQTVADLSPADESKLVQLPDGTLMVNSRKKAGQRFEHRSNDNGKTWTTQPFGPVDPRCNASLLLYPARRAADSKDRLIFCNAASATGRQNLTLRISDDNGQTWSKGNVVDPGPSAYSELTILADGSIGVLYEPGYQEIRFLKFTLDQLLQH